VNRKNLTDNFNSGTSASVSDLDSKLKQIDDIQSFLLGSSWSGSGNDFFEALAEYLAGTLAMDYVCIDRLLETGLEAQTLAVYYDGNFDDNLRYALKDTPCGKVVKQMVCCFPERVRFLFPKDAVLQEMVAESYAGITLYGSNGKPIGLIAVIGRKPIADPEYTKILLKMVSIRAANELEHRQIREEIINSRNKLEVLVETRTAELQTINKTLKKEIRLRRQKEKSLLIAEEKYRTVADFTYDWETWVGPDGKFIYVSPSCLKITGYSVDEFMDDPSLVIKITHPEDREIVQKHYCDSINGEITSCCLDFRIIKKNGEERWISHSCQSVFNAEGKSLGQRGSNKDITERKRAESILMDSQKQLRALTKRIIAISEDERTRIAREIHDELGHLLTSLKYDIERLSLKSDLSADLLDQELNSMSGILDSIIDSVRKIATELRPGILDHLGLFPAIEWQIDQFRNRTNISCKYFKSVEDISFDKNETIIIYRILQEVLTNIARHSKADRVCVSLSKKNRKFYLIISDNGIGFDVKNKINEYSLGLLGMNERALSIGGQLRIESKKGKGTTITLILEKK
jgi:two-component system, NarL family, sensor histidine kinase UhpB